jgi:hypothetical protein
VTDKYRWKRLRNVRPDYADFLAFRRPPRQSFTTRRLLVIYVVTAVVLWVLFLAAMLGGLLLTPGL